MPRLLDKIALVTGAARGIGAGIAQAFVREGARVVLTDVRDTLGASAATACGERAEYQRLDVREERDWERVVASMLERFGRVDVVVNNAGITGFESIEQGTPPPAHDPEQATLADWRAVLATNLDGVFLGCRYAIRAMRARRPSGAGGSIVNISSRSGLVGIPAAAAYAASKAAVRNHTKSVALYCAERGLPIRCNSVHPAAIRTPMWEAMLGPADAPDRAAREAAMVADTPLRRFGTVDEVAAVVVYLASDESSYTTGAELVLDGGLLAGSAAVPGR
ncbi:MAG TPA: glucose 1-dehydrogenase [Gemmatimonadaceae bacterium]|nr:glucose 1-dehydrogenase [Gemmatimonadaceae bacterium]